MVCLDSTGRTYTVPAHGLPSARGQGEPLSGTLTPPAGAAFAGIMMGADEDLYLLSTAAGYGFIAPLGEMHTKNRKGKSTLKVPLDARALVPQKICDMDRDWLAIVTTAGYMLVYMVGELPQMNKGRGVKLINIPAKRRKAGEESVLAVLTFAEDDTLLIYSGKRYLRMKPSDIDHYIGARGLRGRKLPRGFQHVRGMAIE